MTLAQQKNAELTCPKKGREEKKEKWAEEECSSNEDAEEKGEAAATAPLSVHPFFRC